MAKGFIGIVGNESKFIALFLKEELIGKEDEIL